MVPLFVIWMVAQIHCVALGSPFSLTVMFVAELHVVPTQV